MPKPQPARPAAPVAVPAQPDPQEGGLTFRVVSMDALPPMRPGGHQGERKYAKIEEMLKLMDPKKPKPIAIPVPANTTPAKFGTAVLSGVRKAVQIPGMTVRSRLGPDKTNHDIVSLFLWVGEAGPMRKKAAAKGGA